MAVRTPRYTTMALPEELRQPVREAARSLGISPGRYVESVLAGIPAPDAAAAGGGAGDGAWGQERVFLSLPMRFASRRRLAEAASEALMRAYGDLLEGRSVHGDPPTRSRGRKSSWLVVCVRIPRAAASALRVHALLAHTTLSGIAAAYLDARRDGDAD